MCRAAVLCVVALCWIMIAGSHETVCACWPGLAWHPRTSITALTMLGNRLGLAVRADAPPPDIIFSSSQHNPWHNRCFSHESELVDSSLTTELEDPEAAAASTAVHRILRVNHWISDAENDP